MLEREPIAHQIKTPRTFLKAFGGFLLVALLAGIGTGYILAASKSSTPATPLAGTATTENPTHAQQDAKTFRDFAEGKIAKKPAPKDGEEYTEGTHLLIRTGQTPVTLTSSVIDLSKYEGKDVKVYGETQKAISSGWLMDVGRVDVK